MPEVKYRRLDAGEPEVVQAFGRSFKEGEAIEVPDALAEKVRGNPTFAVKGEKTFGDDGVSREDASIEAEERLARAEATRRSAEETRKAKQAESQGRAHREDRA